MDNQMISRRLQTLNFLDERATMLFPDEYHVCGIYAIINKMNGKLYIGKTSQKIYRYIRKERIEKLRKGEMHNSLLQKEFNSFGEKNFSFFIIEKILNVDSSDFFQKKLHDTLNYLEVFYINKFQSSDRKYGYNYEIGGTNDFTIDDIKLLIEKEFKKRDKWVYGELSGSRKLGFGIREEFINKKIKIPPNGLGTIIDMFLKVDHHLFSFEDYCKKFILTYNDRDYVKENCSLIPWMIAQQIIKKYPDTEIIKEVSK
ncbi:GIY-YIG nuclease family protein [Paenibacillus dendritiformis]|uniref:Intron-encoded endonuclease bI1 n=1 Tax=Paenibacillus dendritiformis C454 TaxID=1131935 RepID=H3S9F7_9BACL|nr:GIY-YIG nuclease family protein [Paenibacillus dendritiformis]EHQ64405.1 intron-encoded endonuclease bI1 [Paenibacillus dendritiformis C454]CAH8770381.1 GIY-YIG nuclease family protein [Paenibacillus dendritiformis]